MGQDTDSIRKTITSQSKEALIKALEIHLDTRDKRFMFMKLSFKDFTPMIDLEGSPRVCAWRIYEYFEKQQMLGSLMAHINSGFDDNLLLELK